MYNEYYYPDYLMHYGVKGMKWGHRKRQAFSIKAAGHRALGKMYELNEKTYKKSNKALSSMNAQAKNQQLKKAEAAQAEANKKREARNTPEAKAARRKTALKVGAAAAGTALAAYGAYKVHNFVREKNQEIRVNEGKAKCDRMLKKLDRMHLNDIIKDSSATQSWVKTGKQKTPFQYNNNGKSVTIPRQYRNPQSALKPMQYRNIENKVIDKTISEAYDKARNDSFKTAAKNVSRHYVEKAKDEINRRRR